MTQPAIASEMGIPDQPTDPSPPFSLLFGVRLCTIIRQYRDGHAHFVDKTRYIAYYMLYLTIAIVEVLMLRGGILWAHPKLRQPER